MSTSKLILVFTIGLSYLTPSAVSAFNIGDKIKVITTPLRVRVTPRGTTKGNQLIGSAGTIIGGPSIYGNDVRWNIDYLTGADGWSSEKFISKYTIANIDKKNILRAGTTSTVTVNNTQNTINSTSTAIIKDKKDDDSLTLKVLTVGQGTITTVPEGINCGSICVAKFLKSVGFLINYNPSNGWAFDSFSGNCMGIYNCTPTENSDTLIAKFIPIKTNTAIAPQTNNISVTTTSTKTTRDRDMPTLENIKGKTLSGPINAKSGQVIENLHITNPDGPCITITDANNVIIKNNEIGPCGSNTKTVRNEGVYIYKSSNITIQNNVIHDMSTGVSVVNSASPIIIDRNLIYNIRGPYWQGQMVQFNNVRGGYGSSKITCNVKDGANQPDPISGPNFNEDHISMYNTLGVSTSSPIEIAYNRIRGETSGAGESGSGIALGDSPAGGGGIGSAESGNYYVHDNNIVRTNNVGIAIIGGHDIRIENNKVENNGTNLASMTGESYTIKKYDTASTCYNISYTGNRGAGRVWAYAHDGGPSSGLLDRGGCNFTESNNNFKDNSLTASIFDEVHASCIEH